MHIRWIDNVFDDKLAMRFGIFLSVKWQDCLEMPYFKTNNTTIDRWDNILKFSHRTICDGKAILHSDRSIHTCSAKRDGNCTTIKWLCANAPFMLAYSMHAIECGMKCGKFKIEHETNFWSMRFVFGKFVIFSRKNIDFEVLQSILESDDFLSSIKCESFPCSEISGWNW